MKKLIAIAILMLFAGTSQADTKLTYSTAELEAAGANNVASIVERYVTDTDRTTLISPDKVLFLVDGRPVTSVDDQLPSSNRVEVLTDGDSVVINVVTKPSVGGG
ncbi:hypothetical protein ACOPJQ_09135 [Luteimonas dalianensis]|uniref:hypothetical protein n=1 Tax=Luteimonas dalianensis TaxID=1148196 RepID=UPI003BF18FB8